MTARNIPARIVALSISGAFHVVLIAALFGMWPAPSASAPPVAHDARAASGQGQRSTLPRRASSENVLKATQSAPDNVARAETSWRPLAMVANAGGAVGDRTLNH